MRLKTVVVESLRREELRQVVELPGVEGADRRTRCGRGIPPSSSADGGWVQHMLAGLKEGGRMAVVLDTGEAIDALFGHHAACQRGATFRTSRRHRRRPRRNGEVISTSIATG